jgi:glycine hydroxymethyltransferase
MKDGEMRQIAAWITEVLTHPEDKAVAERVHGGVREMCRQYPAPAEAG